MIRYRAAALTFAVVGALSCSPHPERDQAKTHVRAALEVESASFCANLLTLIEKGNIDQARKLAEWRMSSALKSADRDTVDGLDSEVATPNLEEGLRRAIDYAHRNSLDPEVTAAAERLLSRLESH